MLVRDGRLVISVFLIISKQVRKQILALPSRHRIMFVFPCKKCFFFKFFSVPCRKTDYCDEHVRLTVCLHVCSREYLWNTHTHTHTFDGPFSGTIQVSRYQKGKTNLDFAVARDSEWQWHQLGHVQVCTSLQTDNHASTPPLSFYRPDALPGAQPTA